MLRYGNARELCLGLDVVTPAGAVWEGLSGLRKDNTSYSLRDLYIGSEGTLGVITAATLRLAPQPAARMMALASCKDLGATTALLQLAHTRLGPGLTGSAAMGDFALALVRRPFPQLRQPRASSPAAVWTVLLEQSDSEGEVHARALSLFEGLLQAALQRGLIADGAVSE